MRSCQVEPQRREQHDASCGKPQEVVRLSSNTIVAVNASSVLSHTSSAAPTTTSSTSTAATPREKDAALRAGRARSMLFSVRARDLGSSSSFSFFWVSTLLCSTLLSRPVVLFCPVLCCVVEFGGGSGCSLPPPIFHPNSTMDEARERRQRELQEKKRRLEELRQLKQSRAAAASVSSASASASASASTSAATDPGLLALVLPQHPELLPPAMSSTP